MTTVVRLKLSLGIFQNDYDCDFGEALTLQKKGVKESFEIFINSRDTFVNIPVDEDQAALVPDPSKILKKSFGP